jgi:hypothetical protein
MNAVPLPAPNEYEVILRGLSDDELHAIIEALATLDTGRRTDEAERLGIAIVRELSTREAYMRTSRRNHPSAHDS